MKKTFFIDFLKKICYNYNIKRGVNSMWEKIVDIHVNDYEEAVDCYQVDYNKETGQYRISMFKDCHWQNEIIFDEVKNNDR